MNIYIVTDSAVAGFGRVRQSLSVTSLGFRTLLSTAKCYRFGATLTTAVSGAITPAGSAQFSGYASRTTIPKYTCTLPAGRIYPDYRLVLSETERSRPVCNHFRFYIQIERIDHSSARHKLIQSRNFKRISQIYWGHRGTRHKQSIHNNVIINL